MYVLMEIISKITVKKKKSNIQDNVHHMLLKWGYLEPLLWSIMVRIPPPGQSCFLLALTDAGPECTPQ